MKKPGTMIRIRPKLSLSCLLLLCFGGIGKFYVSSYQQLRHCRLYGTSTLPNLSYSGARRCIRNVPLHATSDGSDDEDENNVCSPRSSSSSNVDEIPLDKEETMVCPAPPPPTKNEGMTTQERIIAQLGLPPESDSEKEERKLRREAAEQALTIQKKTNFGTGISSFLLAISFYIYQFLNPIPTIQILNEMQMSSAPLTNIGNGKPTVVDFWAPWCENCKDAAPTLKLVEDEYKDRVNFVAVNADLSDAGDLINRFDVDAIPHMALISSEGDVETALIGPIPYKVMKADLDALLENAAALKAKDGSASSATKKELPYVMLDVFKTHPEDRRIKF